MSSTKGESQTVVRCLVRIPMVSLVGNQTRVPAHLERIHPDGRILAKMDLQRYGSTKERSTRSIRMESVYRHDMIERYHILLLRRLSSEFGLCGRGGVHAGTMQQLVTDDMSHHYN
jgi:hypothetical protein